MLRRNGPRFAPTRLHRVVGHTLGFFIHSMLGMFEEAWFGDRASRMPPPREPLFVLGHWRSGTTWLHELLSLDPRHAWPTTYQCLFPDHFLLTESVLPWFLSILLPEKRPMDDMPMGFDKPQEDEFALMWMGAISPYEALFFSDRDPEPGALTLEGLEPEVLELWKATLLRFLNRVSLRSSGKRLVLKSPTHTARLPVLDEMFPDAKYVNIVRNPHHVFPSVEKTARALTELLSIRDCTFEGLHERIFREFLILHERLEEGRRKVDPARFIGIKYEDLKADTEDCMKSVYDHLGLGGFDEYLPRLRAYLADRKDYKTNRFEPDAALEAKIAQRWGEVIRKYGYATGSR